MNTGKDLSVKLVEFVDAIGLSRGLFGVEHEGRVWEVVVNLIEQPATKPDQPSIKPTTGFNSGAHSVTGQV